MQRDLSSEGAPPHDGGRLEAAVDQGRVDGVLAGECRAPGECEGRSGPGCEGVWDCVAGRCVFACNDCIDEDGDHRGVGAGCLGTDCDDKDATVYPGAVERCDGKDNDCDGQIDEGFGQLVCGVGVCRVYIEACAKGVVQSCQPGAPGIEYCAGVVAVDENCDSRIDEFCPCVDGTTQPCYSGSPGEVGVGECRAGVQTCKDNSWGRCEGEQGPTPERCDGLDNDCDGSVDEALEQPPCELGAGVCATARATNCGGTRGWLACRSEAFGHDYEAKESLCDGLDNDCNGSVDEGCPCTQVGTVRLCGSTVGSCRRGRQTCEQGVWSLCLGAQTAGAEICDGVDNNCDGRVDEGFDKDGDGYTSCGTVAGGGIDPARADCNDDNPLIHPNATEHCDGVDNDCNGLVDDAPRGAAQSLDAGAAGVADGGAGTDLSRDGGIRADGSAAVGDQVEFAACACNNGLDDDGDGVADADDPGCSSSSDPYERGTAACDDGKDNDGDGKADYPADPGCSGPGDNSERGTVACDDGVDNDGDGQIDYRVDGSGDPGCAGPADTSERGTSACDDGIDNDGDGKIDYRADGSGDPGCAGPADTSELGTAACDDGIDNDGDGKIDYRADGSGDPGCSGPSDTSERGTAACDDGVDNDGDGTTDYRADGSGDPGCAGPDDNSERGTAACDDGIDNDGDGQADFPADPECTSPADTSESCTGPAECASLTCLASGRCAAQKGVVYVDDDCLSGGEGTLNAPFCSVVEALAAGVRVIRLRPGVYGPLTLNSPIEIYGEPGVVLQGPGVSCRALVLEAGADAVIAGVTIGGENTAEGGVFLATGARGRLIGNTIGPSLCLGVHASKDSYIELEGNFLTGNTGGGAHLEDVSGFVMVNNIVADNGSDLLPTSGVRLKPNGLPALFINNTVVGNRSVPGPRRTGVRCDPTGAVPNVSIVNSVLWGNTPAEDTGEQFSVECLPTFSIAQGVTPGPTLWADDPLFVGAGVGAAAYHLQLGSPCIDRGTSTDAPTSDIDGDPRHGAPDLGADEQR